MRRQARLEAKKRRLRLGREQQDLLRRGRVRGQKVGQGQVGFLRRLGRRAERQRESLDVGVLHCQGQHFAVDLLKVGETLGEGREQVLLLLTGTGSEDLAHGRAQTLDLCGGGARLIRELLRVLIRHSQNRALFCLGGGRQGVAHAPNHIGLARFDLDLLGRAAFALVMKDQQNQEKHNGRSCSHAKQVCECQLEFHDISHFRARWCHKSKNRATCEATGKMKVAAM
jgi:hypothetical protein